MITVNTEIKAPLERVWNCWTLPEHITHWNFASDDWCCPSATNDLRPGGDFSWRMEARDGSMGFDFNGTYDSIKKGQCIACTLEDGRKVEITFEEHPDGVTVTESFEPESINPVEMQRAGWQAILNNFKGYVESKTT